MKVMHRLAALAAVLLVSACASLTLVSADKPALVGNGVTVMPQIQWNQISGEHVMWTLDGPSVNSLHFLTGIRSGRAIFHIPGVEDKFIGIYDDKMLPNDIQDLFVSSLGKQGDKNVRPGNLAPCPFGASKGFCFDLSYTNANDLEMKAMVMVRKEGNLLDAFLFEAPSEYYFTTLSPTVGKVFASAQTK